MENINWLNEVESRQDALIEDLFRLLKIDSVRDDEKATAEAPVGPGPLAALEEFLTMAQEDGFETKQFGPWAGRVEIGSGDELMGILGHVDVVPAGSGWETNPFEPVIKDNRIYARGSSDDKGPTVAAYFAIKLLRELGVEFNKRVHLIIGTDEESGWQCMDHYFKEAEMPDFGFSPDANFPIINGEKGNVSAIFTFPQVEINPVGYSLVSFKAGLRPNMVPEDAKAVIEGSNIEFIQESFETFVEQHEEITAESSVSENRIELTVYGKSAHGSTPSKGVNSATYLASFLQKFEFNSTSAGDFVHLLSQLLHLNFDGAKLGVAHHHEVMGDVSMNVGIANFDIEKGGKIDANFRFPEGTDPETMLGQINTAVENFRVNVEMTDGKEPHYVPADDPLVETLLDVYHKQTGFEAHEQSIGGGTYGRLMPRGVAYGALFPDSIDTMHQANEFLALEDLTRATAIYAEAIYRLTR